MKKKHAEVVTTLNTQKVIAVTPEWRQKLSQFRYKSSGK